MVAVREEEWAEVARWAQGIERGLVLSCLSTLGMVVTCRKEKGRLLLMRQKGPPLTLVG